MKISIYYNTHEDHSLPGGAAHLPFFSIPCDNCRFILVDEGEWWVSFDTPTTRVLEDVYRAYNVVEGDERPVELEIRSMSVGDAVGLENGETYAVASIGFVALSDNWLSERTVEE